MCGIAGEIKWNGNLHEKGRSVYETMQQTLSRRGPDQKGIYMDNDAALIHARLAVVDIENGRQPMHLKTGDQEYILVYNGELYNTDELRQQLVQLGHRFIGHSDTEVLLHSYAQWKDDCVDRFNGIFAFAVLEKHNRRLFMARDRIGVKPFFYALRENSFIFGSEIKALLAHPLIQPEINLESIAEIMLTGPGRTPGYGVFHGIEELPLACCAVYDNDGLKLRRYWRLMDRENNDSFDETVEKTRKLVIDAIQRQLVSDVPVCTFLSGGLDSSIISAVADKYFTGCGKKLHTFSVTYKDNEQYFKASKFQPNSDEHYIQVMNDFLHAEHHHITLDTPQLITALFDAVDARDLPGMADVDSSLLLFCREIKNYATVALSGECADEIFGGYPWFRDKTIREQEGFPWAQTTEFRASFLTPDFLKEIDPFHYVDNLYRKTIEDTHTLPGCSQEEKRMKEMVNLNFQWFMQTLLDRKDRMSMYSGLEVRVPFCDYRIAEYLYTVPWEYKDYQGREKGLLRKAMEGILPDEVLYRKKSPYPKTHNPSYLKSVSALLKDVIADPNAPIHQFIKKDALEGLLIDDRSVPWYGQLMTTPQTIAYFLQINYWLQAYKIRII